MTRFTLILLIAVTIFASTGVVLAQEYTECRQRFESPNLDIDFQVTANAQMGQPFQVAQSQCVIGVAQEVCQALGYERAGSIVVRPEIDGIPFPEDSFDCAREQGRPWIVRCSCSASDLAELTCKSNSPRGDVNYDNQINLTDLYSLIQAFFGGGELFCDEAGDVNGDGRENILDIDSLASMVAG